MYENRTACGLETLRKDDNNMRLFAAKTCTKLDLAHRISISLNNSVEPEQVKRIIDAFHDEILMTVAENRRIEIRGFGVYKSYHYHPRMGRNPKTGEIFKIPKHTGPHFKFSPEALKIFDEKRDIVSLRSA